MAGARPRVIKQGAPAAVPRDPVAEAQARAQAIRSEAEEEAARIRSLAQEARALAVVEGLAEGRAAAAAALVRVAQVREERLGALEGLVAEVALDVAGRLAREALAATPEAVLGVTRRALRAAAATGEVVLRVAPADLPLVRGAADALAALVERGSLTVVEDAALGRGEVVVESSGGRVDARVDAQLEAFRRALAAEDR